MGYARYMGHHEKSKPMNHEKRRGDTKYMYNLFNRTIAENLPNLKRESHRCRKLTEHQTIRTKKEVLSDMS
jgi:hypothetical protein